MKILTEPGVVRRNIKWRSTLPAPYIHLRHRDKGCSDRIGRAANPLDGITPVSEEMLTEAPAGDWLTWRPPPNSDGRYGRLQAINLDSRELAWAHRQRAPLTSGLLTTAGDLVFGADLQRNIAAYDGDTGEELWSIRLNDVAVSAPISFLVDGKQCVAVTAGHGVMSMARRSLVPEIRLPMKPAATLWVFEIPNL